MNATVKSQTRELIDKGRHYYLSNYKPREVILDHGKGARLWDLDGKEYIDFGTGISVNSLGHQDPELVEALVAQAHKLWHTTNIYFTEPTVRLAEELVSSCLSVLLHIGVSLKISEPPAYHRRLTTRSG